ncbi:MAG TPA: RNA polymerase sigma factor [Bryobacteraceae bacterium]|jgi:RNA polymerase sigma-70 factor (ECF subfamily)|nr:RNA polymerase sigma factor [Bryobacteraceae bacterium]
MTRVADLDTQLMVRVQEDDHSSFGLLLNRNRSIVLNYLSRMVANRAIAEELAQDVFVRIYRSRRRYAPSAKFSTWLYRITTNVALNHFRDEKRNNQNISLDVQDAAQVHLSAWDHAPLIEDRLVREVIAEQIRRAVRSLPPKQRAAVIMHKYDELDYAQIAKVLGCTPAAVKALMFRAYETLRLRLRSLQQIGGAGLTRRVDSPVDLMR